MLYTLSLHDALPILLLLPALEPEDLGDGVGGLGARDRRRREELEVVLLGRVVEAEAEQAGDRLAAEAGRNREAGRPGARDESGRGVGEADRAQQPRVEL